MQVGHQTASRSAGLFVTLSQHPMFSKAVVWLIIINAILVGLETYPALAEPYEAWFVIGDHILLWLFTAELVIRIAAARPWSGFMKDGWNVFDFVIVLAGHLFADSGFVTVLRMMRIIRVLRAISVIPSLRRIVNALLLTIPALGNITLLLSLLFYIYAVMGTSLFGELNPEYFGTLHQTLLTLFQIILLDGVMDIIRPLIEAMPWCWTYFVSFILFGTFVIFNLFIGVIVSNIEKVDQAEVVRDEDDKRREEISEVRLHIELQELKNEIRALRESLPKSGS